MPIKVTTILQAATAASADSLTARVGGWTELFWSSLEDLNTAQEAVEKTAPAASRSILVRRAELLPTTAAVRGYRLQRYALVDQALIPMGAARVRRTGSLGQFPALTDVPQSALLVQTGFVGQSRTTTLRLAGLPDSQVTNGEFSPNALFIAAFDRWKAALASDFGSIIQTFAEFSIVKVMTITEAGLMTVDRLPGAGFPPGSLVKVRRTTLANNEQGGGPYKVGTTDFLNLTVQLLDWDLGPAKGGTVRVFSREFAKYEESRIVASKSVVRKVGSPFGRYRGRRSKKR